MLWTLLDSCCFARLWIAAPSSPLCLSARVFALFIGVRHYGLLRRNSCTLCKSFRQRRRLIASFRPTNTGTEPTPCSLSNIVATVLYTMVNASTRLNKSTRTVTLCAREREFNQQLISS